MGLRILWQGDGGKSLVLGGNKIPMSYSPQFHPVSLNRAGLQGYNRSSQENPLVNSDTNPVMIDTPL